MKNVRSWVGMFLVLTVVEAVAASPEDFTGNPSTDGWTLSGNSLAIGTYIRGVADLPFDVYSQAFIITTNSPLWDGTLADANSGLWHPGDEILGLGGIMTTSLFFQTRLVAKFGAVGSTFSASTLASPNGNGNGSFSGGDAGLGGVQVDYQYAYNGAGTKLSPADQNGGLELPDHVLYYDGISAGGTNLDMDYGAVLADFQRVGGRDLLVSWEVALDITALSDSNRADLGTQVPILGGKGDMALQIVTNGAPDTFTDGLVTQIIPEPSTSSLVFASLAVCGWLFRRRRSAKM